MYDIHIRASCTVAHTHPRGAVGTHRRSRMHIVDVALGVQQLPAQPKVAELDDHAQGEGCAVWLQQQVSGLDIAVHPAQGGNVLQPQGNAMRHLSKGHHK